jgi:tetratricopeptide (TPR) repeat protein
MKTWFARLLLVLTCVGLATPAIAQEQDLQKLFEAGKFQEVVEKTPGDAPPDAQYRKGLAHRKLDQNDQAKEAFGRLSSGGDAWNAVGESARAQIDGNLDGALEAATKAVAQGPDLAAAHYQLGLVQEARGENGAAATEFARAAEIDPQMAYAHYMAGMNFYKAKRVDKMAVYFENFLRLAPSAPEAPAVQSIMKTVRGR